MKKLLLVLLTFMISFTALNLSAQETITVADGTTTNSYIPVYGLYVDEYTRSQTIYPSSMLEDMLGAQITSMTFYFSSSPSNNWPGNSFDVKITTTSLSSISSFQSGTMTTVYSGPITPSNGTLVVTFDDPFIYNGENLLVEFYQTSTASYADGSFYGISYTGASISGYNSSSASSASVNARNFIPKTTFAYEPGTGICSKPSGLVANNVTDNSATLSWSTNGTPVSWDIYAANGITDVPNENTVATYSTTDTFYNLTNLTPSTNYFFYVRSVCGANDMSGWKEIRFMTSQIPAQLPYLCDFEDATENSNWQFANDNQTNQWFIGTAVNNTENGENALYISNDGGLNNDYTDVTSAVYAYRDIEFPSSSNDFLLSFSWKNQGESNGNYECLRVYMGTPEFVTAGSGNYSGATLQHATRLGTYYENGSSWSEASILLSNSNYAGQIQRLYFFFYSDGSGHYAPPAAVDNITVSELACGSVDSAIVSNITTTSADISLYSQSSTDFVLYYKTVTDTAWSEANVNTVPFTLDNLMVGTQYICHAKADCGGEYGFPSDDFTFSTECDIVSTFPWIEGFEADWTTEAVAPGNKVAPFCWLNFANGYSNSNYYWRQSGEAHTGSHSAEFYSGYATSSSYTHNDWLISPVLALTGNERVNFYVEGTSSYYVDDIAVYAIDVNNGDIANFSDVQANATCLMQPYIPAYDWEEIELPLSNLNGNYRLAFVRNAAAGGAYLNLDDITVSEMPSCPRVFNLTAEVSTPTAAAINFRTDNGTGDGWELAYDETGLNGAFDPTTATNTIIIPDGTSMPYVLNNLTTGVEYTLAVRQACGGEWTDTITITLPNFTNVTVPFSCGFEDADQNENWTITNYSGASNVFYIGGATANASDSSLYISSDQGTTNTYIGTEGVSVAYVNVSFGNADQYILSFDWKMNGESEYDYASACLVPFNVDVTPTSSSIPSWVNTYKLSNETYQVTGHTNWETVSVVLNGSDVNNTTKRLAFVWRNDGSLQNDPPVAIDNVTVNELTCTIPAGLAVSGITTDEATLSWTAGENDAEWLIQLGQNGVWTDIAAYENPFTLDNLSAATNYQVRIATICNGTDTSNFTSITSFTTECSALEMADLPYFDNLETYSSGDFLNCWTRVIPFDEWGTTVPYIDDHEDNAYSGSNSLYWRSDLSNPTTIASPRINEEIHNIQVTFQLLREGENSGTFQVGVMSDLNDITTFEPVVTLDPIPENYSEYTVRFNNTVLSGTGNYIVFRQLSLPSYDNWYYWMDDIEISIIPDCPRPENFTFSNLTTESVTLSWRETGEATTWNILYGPTGFDIENDGTLINVYDTTELIENLSAITYDFYVQADCGSETSMWRGPLQITPGSFNINATGTDTVNMCGGIIYDDGGQNGDYSSSCNSIVVVNPDAPGMLVQLSGTYYLESHSWDKLDIYDGVGTDGELLWSNPSTTSNDTVPTLTSSTGSLTISFITDGSGVYDGFALQVSCIEAPSCLKPLNLTATPISSSEISLSWIENGTATAWNVEYGAPGFTPGTGTIVSATSNPFTVTGLNTYTTYEFYVQANCGGGDESEWSNAATVTTDCDVTVAPYTQNFDATTSMPGCWWQEYVVSDYDWEVVTPTSSPATAHSGTNAARFSVSSFSAHITRLVMPTLDITGLTTPTLTFWHTQAAWGSDQDTLGVYYRANATDNWTYLASYTNNITDWTEETITLPSPSANYQIAFLGYAAYGHGIFIDDVTIDNGSGTSTCDTPTGLATSGITQTAANVSWTAGSASAWNVQYKTAAASTWSNNIPVTTPNYSFSGLTANTQYNVRVQADCGNGNTSDWATIDFTTLDNDVETCPTPTNFQATVNDLTATFSWNQEAGTATEWTLNYKKVSDNTWTNVTVTTNPYTITDLATVTEYEAYLVANCSNGLTSDPTATIHFTTTNVGVSDYLANDTKLFPNPATNTITIQNNNVVMNTVAVYDVYGKLLNTISVNSNSVEINVANLADGMYFARIMTDNGMITKSFIKK